MQLKSPSSGGHHLAASRWWPAALAFAALVCGGADGEAWLEAATCVAKLGAPSDSALIASGFPAPESSVYLSFSYSEPGSLLDTVGINAASDGDWALRAEGDSTLMLSLYTRSGGWQRIALASRVEPGRDYYAILKVKAGILSSEVYEGEQLLNGLSARLAVLPSASPVYAGDFPGDNGWGSGYNIHQGIVGRVAVHYLGPWIDELTPETIRHSIVKPAAGPGGSVAEGGASGGSAASGGAAGAGAPESLELQVADVLPAQSPEDAVRLILEAQIRGDVPVMLGYTYLEQSPSEAQLATQALMRVVAQRLSFSALDIELGGTAYGQQGNLALVRCRHAVFVEGGGVASQEAFGSLVLLRRTHQGWKVVQFMADDLLNMEHESAAGVSGSTSIKIAYALPATEGIYGTAAQNQDAESSPNPGMVDYAKLSQQFGAAINGWQFDELKIFADETFSLYGWCPFYGDLVSSGYTAVQSVRTIYNELLPDLWALDLELVGYDMTQIAVGVLQIMSEPIPGLDVAADNLGIAVDTWKYNVTQSRHFSRLRLALAYANLEGLKKYLFLRPAPIHRDPEHGISTGMQVNLELEPYPGWTGSQVPLKKLNFMSDLPLRFWQHLDFDIGFQFTIRRSESEALYDAAVALGLQGKSEAGISTEHTVTIPVRLGTMSQYRLIAGEFDPQQLAKDPRREARPQLVESGSPILRNARIISGERAADRFIRLDITPAAGPNQTIQIKLLTGDNDLTEPLVIENAVYNNLAGVVALDNYETPILGADPELQLAPGQTAEFTILGKHPECPFPRIIGAPVSAWSIEHPAIATLEVVGAFPDAKLRLRGQAPGLTYLRCKLETGDRQARRSLEEVLLVRVMGGYKLENVTVFDPDSVNGFIDCKDGSGTGVWTLSEMPDMPPYATIKGSWNWTPPPQYLTGDAPVWDLKCNFSFDVESDGSRDGLVENFGWAAWLDAPVWIHIDKRVVSWGQSDTLSHGHRFSFAEKIPLADFLIGGDGVSPGWNKEGDLYLTLHFRIYDTEPSVRYTYRQVNK